MSRLARRFAASVVALASITVVELSAESPQQAFVKSWEGQDVVVKQTLYALVYNERGRLGNTYGARRDGLTVVTPNQGVYFQFDGRQGRDEVIQRDPQKILEAVNVEYQGDGLDVRSYRKLEALVLTRYDPGARYDRQKRENRSRRRPARLCRGRRFKRRRRSRGNADGQVARTALQVLFRAWADRKPDSAIHRRQATHRRLIRHGGTTFAGAMPREGQTAADRHSQADSITDLLVTFQFR